MPEPREDPEPSFDDRLAERHLAAIERANRAEVQALAFALNLIRPLSPDEAVGA